MQLFPVKSLSNVQEKYFITSVALLCLNFFVSLLSTVQILGPRKVNIIGVLDHLIDKLQILWLLYFIIFWGDGCNPSYEDN